MQATLSTGMDGRREFHQSGALRKVRQGARQRPFDRSFQDPAAGPVGEFEQRLSLDGLGWRSLSMFLTDAAPPPTRGRCGLFSLMSQWAAARPRAAAAASSMCRRSRKIFPSTADRDIPPRRSAIVTAVSPSPHSFRSNAMLSSVHDWPRIWSAPFSRARSPARRISGKCFEGPPRTARFVPPAST